MTQFNNNMTQLDALNDLGYRMALSEEKSLELRELNHKWQRLYSEAKERNKTLQGIILIQQDFSEKCDAWMTFLAQTEHDLSTEIAGNLPDLVTQQRKCEVSYRSRTFEMIFFQLQFLLISQFKYVVYLKVRDI